jgi:hypothetical protein
MLAHTQVASPCCAPLAGWPTFSPRRHVVSPETPDEISLQCTMHQEPAGQKSSIAQRQYDPSTSESPLRANLDLRSTDRSSPDEVCHS